jgi:hypothetical protein
LKTRRGAGPGEGREEGGREGEGETIDEKTKRSKAARFSCLSPSAVVVYLRGFHFQTLGMAMLLLEALLPPAKGGEEGGGQAWREEGRRGGCQCH